MIFVIEVLLLPFPSQCRYEVLRVMYCNILCSVFWILPGYFSICFWTAWNDHSMCLCVCTSKNLDLV